MSVKYCLPVSVYSTFGQNYCTMQCSLSVIAEHLVNIITSKASEKLADLHNPTTFNNSFCSLGRGQAPLKP